MSYKLEPTINNVAALVKGRAPAINRVASMVRGKAPARSAASCCKDCGSGTQHSLARGVTSPQLNPVLSGNRRLVPGSRYIDPTQFTAIPLEQDGGGGEPPDADGDSAYIDAAGEEAYAEYERQLEEQNAQAAYDLQSLEASTQSCLVKPCPFPASVENLITESDDRMMATLFTRVDRTIPRIRCTVVGHTRFGTVPYALLTVFGTSYRAILDRADCNGLPLQGEFGFAISANDQYQQRITPVMVLPVTHDATFRASFFLPRPGNHANVGTSGADTILVRDYQAVYVRVFVPGFDSPRPPPPVRYFVALDNGVGLPPTSGNPPCDIASFGALNYWSTEPPPVFSPVGPADYAAFRSRSTTPLRRGILP